MHCGPGDEGRSSVTPFEEGFLDSLVEDDEQDEGEGTPQEPVSEEEE